MASLHKFGKNWYAGFSVINDDPDRKRKYKVVWKSLKTSNKTLAKQRLAQMEVEQQRGELALNNHKILLRDFISNHYLPWAKANKAPKTYTGNIYSCNHFMKLYGNQYLSSISAYMIQRFKDERKLRVGDLPPFSDHYELEYSNTLTG